MLVNKVLKHWKYDQWNRSKERTYKTKMWTWRVHRTFSSSSGTQNKTRSRQCVPGVSCGPSTITVPSNCQQKHRGMAQKKTNRRLVFIYLLPGFLPPPCCSLWSCLINLASAPTRLAHFVVLYHFPPRRDADHSANARRERKTVSLCTTDSILEFIQLTKVVYSNALNNKFNLVF